MNRNLTQIMENRCVLMNIFLKTLSDLNINWCRLLVSFVKITLERKVKMQKTLDFTGVSKNSLPLNLVFSSWN